MVELIIEGQRADLSDDIAADVTYSLADIRTPDKRQVNYTKTITLVGTATNNYIFGHIYNIDVENDANNPALPNIGVNYTPKKLALAVLIVDGVQVFDGTLRLWKIVLKGGVIFYEVSLFGKLFDLFSAIGDGKLSDLDFSALNHAYNWTNIKATWEDTYSGAFRYSLIDYGYNVQDSGGKPSTIKFGSLIPSLYYKVYLDKIFSAAGSTFALNFADPSILNKILVTPPASQALGMPNYFSLSRAANINYNTFSVDTQYTGAKITDTVGSNAIGLIVEAMPGDATLQRYRFPANISTSLQIKIDITSAQDVPFTPPPGTNVGGAILLFNTSGTNDLLGGFSTEDLGRKAFTIEVPKRDFIANEYFYLSLSVPADYNVTIHAGTTIKAVSPIDTADYALVSNDIYEMVRSVPVDVKQVDFLKDFIKLFNLFVTQDPEDPKKFYLHSAS
jgi:hypothetical protein